ncbi:MAG: hypothetical protein Q7K65_01790, partial [Candidatus Buchananbacteria bacterium]|nr:hypothetical protein [Candidatus Buchananbacteria bacterium]
MSVSFVNPHAATAVASSTYDYDRNGNLAAANGWKYNWDYNNRLTDALLGTTTKVRYGYDPEGERTYYTNGADTTVYANKYFNTETHVKTVTTPITQCSPGYRPAAWRRPGIGSCVTYNQTKTVTTNKTTKQIYLGDLLLATVETENG